MWPARFLRPSRRAAAIAALCLCAQPLVGCTELDGAAERGGGAAGDAGAFRAAGPAAAAPVPATPAISPDLFPAPAVFEATGTARWDGRRTLQGVWVAHPQASTARRVRIYSAATGAAADGALFTRDAVLSGPSMLISSDAARLLGLRPGEAAELRVVAVARRASGAADPMTAASVASPGAAAAPVASPGTGDPAGGPSAAPRAAASTGTPASEPALSAIATARPGPAGGDPEDEARQALPAAEAGTGRRDGAGALAQPYVQAGLFAVAGNAERLIGRIEAAGLPALGRPVRLATGPATRVLAGPFGTAAERDAARRAIRAMGLDDAIPVAR